VSEITGGVKSFFEKSPLLHAECVKNHQTALVSPFFVPLMGGTVFFKKKQGGSIPGVCRRGDVKFHTFLSTWKLSAVMEVQRTI
jgi:hypothetical protein